jgi:beta-glucosidase
MKAMKTEWFLACYIGSSMLFGTGSTLVNEVTSAISDEARAIYNGWHNDPNFQGDKKGLIYRELVVNISRNPYWGRINEIYSEDPYLTGRMAVSKSLLAGCDFSDKEYRENISAAVHMGILPTERKV